jgi:hypothetical protein
MNVIAAVITAPKRSHENETLYDRHRKQHRRPRFPECGPPYRGGIFATEVQFADLSGPNHQRLVEIWNSLSGVKSVTRFTSRKAATERIWKAHLDPSEDRPGVLRAATLEFRDLLRELRLKCWVETQARRGSTLLCRSTARPVTATLRHSLTSSGGCWCAAIRIT